MKKTPLLIGILNITPDSFSDGGAFIDYESAIAHTNKLITDGAAIIDIGAESTRPDAKPLTTDEEWQRLEAALPQIIKIAHNKKVQISLDTRHFENAAKAIELGIDWINDVSGLSNPLMINAVKNTSVKLVVMHSLSVPASREIILPDNIDVVNFLKEWAEKRIHELNSYGIGSSRIIFDPGLGFGKNAAQSWEIINRVEEFKTLGVEIYIGHSRKSFLGGDIKERDEKTLKVSAHLTSKNVDYLRVHDIDSHRKLLGML